MRWTLFAAALFAAPGLALAGADHAGDHGHGTSAIGKPGAASDVSRTIRIEVIDNCYDRERIDVRRGETVRFVRHNQCQLVHEFNIGTPKTHHAHQQEMPETMQSGATRPMRMMDTHGHGASMGHDDANPVPLEPGESKELLWSFTTNADNLEFVCNVPGHYQAGMVGCFRVDDR